MNISIFNVLLALILLINALFLLFLAYNSHFKKRKISYYPFISFIIPTYNDSQLIEKTIKGIYDSYDKSKFEIFIINDCSKDNTEEVLLKSKKLYTFNLINNKTNLGKCKSINNVVPLTKGEILFIVDSDVVLKRSAVDDLIARFNSNPRVAAVSARYEATNKSFFTSLQDLYYNFLALIQAAHNHYSSYNLFGGSMAIRKNAFLEVGMLSLNSITEDTDLALKLNEKGYKVEQSLFSVETFAPITFITFYKQQLRWNSGGTQNFLKHYKTFFKNPIFDIFFIFGIFALLLTILSYVIIKPVIFNFPYHVFIFYSEKLTLFNIILSLLIYPLFSIPYLLWGIKKWGREFWHFLLIYPFSLVYLPFLFIVIIHGIIIGVYKFYNLKENDVGWKG